jgi:hypothetical protein
VNAVPLPLPALTKPLAHTSSVVVVPPGKVSGLASVTVAAPSSASGNTAAAADGGT